MTTNPMPGSQMDPESTPFLIEESEKSGSPRLRQSFGSRVLSTVRRLQRYILLTSISIFLIALILISSHRIYIAIYAPSCEDVRKSWWETYSQSLECPNTTVSSDHLDAADSDALVATFHVDRKGLQVLISTLSGLITETIDEGRILLLFGSTKDDLSVTDVRKTNVMFFGMNVYNFSGYDVIISGGSEEETETAVFGWPILSLDNLPAGTYFVKAFLNVYDEKVTRSDGSIVTVRFPCGDGSLPLDGPGGLSTNILQIEVRGGTQTIRLEFQALIPPSEFNGSEIGGCSQGNYRDTDLLKYVKIRSEALSKFWNQDMYVGAKILLPYGYNASDRNTRYPVLYSQFHWLAGEGWWSHDAEFSDAWYRGTIPQEEEKAPGRPTPRLIVVMFRHENPFYDDSYAVNSPNLGPYGDALNDELLPHLDEMFNTISEPYARIQEGGSTGGWAAIANVVFRPDLYGACFASYPDSLDFHKHQDNNLYEQSNAHLRNGLAVSSNRKIGNDGLPHVKVTMAQENHWELTFGTCGRSALQTDIWFAVFGVQGLNGYPLAAWDKVTGQIYPDVIQLWKPMDLTQYITSNWNGELNLGEILRRRLFIYVGGMDSYYLNEGVEQFRSRVAEKGGPNWANVTILSGEPHGGIYNLLPKWSYIDTVLSWISDHAPDGKTPLVPEHTTASSRGNIWQDVLAFGGHEAALARQSPPHIDVDAPDEYYRSEVFQVRAGVGKWDPGVALKAQWLVNGTSTESKGFPVENEQTITYLGNGTVKTLQLTVTGTKRDYDLETRRSNVVNL